MHTLWGLAARVRCHLFCSYHTNYFYHYIREHKPNCYACALQTAFDCPQIQSKNASQLETHFSY